MNSVVRHLATWIVVIALGFGVVDAAHATVRGAVVAGTPVIVGEPRVFGDDLSVSVGSWVNASSYEYEWRVAGVPVSTGVNYQPTQADVGRVVTVLVTGNSGVGESASAQSAPTAPVEASDLDLHLMDFGSGMTVGSTLTAAVTPSTTFYFGHAISGLSIEYQWFSDGLPIPGAISQSFLISLERGGTIISVNVAVSAQGFNTQTLTTATPDRVPIPALFGHVLVSNTDQLFVGSTVKARTLHWSTTSHFSYVWKCNGAPVKHATRSSYTLSLDDRGCIITVSVTGSRQYYRSFTATSPQVDLRAKRPMTDKHFGDVRDLPRPALSGSARTGSRLSVNASGWLKRELLVAFQWYRDGKAIPSATKARYLVTGRDAHASLSVKVTAISKVFAVKTWSMKISAGRVR